MDNAHLNQMVGKTIFRVTGLVVGSDEVVFEFTDGSRIRFFHFQDCCESVLLEELDMSCELSDLPGEVILFAYEQDSSGYKNHPDSILYGGESETWTFYRIGTANCIIVMRWLGTSNGYYSEAVNTEWEMPSA